MIFKFVTQTQLILLCDRERYANSSESKTFTNRGDSKAHEWNNRESRKGKLKNETSRYHADEVNPQTDIDRTETEALEKCRQDKL